MPEHDPLKDLQQAWQDLGPPAPPRDLAGEDARTRRAVAWLQAAWRKLEVPVAVIPRRRRAARLRPIWPAAMAAGLLIGLGFLLFQTGNGAAGRLVPAPEPLAAEAVVLAAADRFEMQSGPVRLTLLLHPEE